MKKYFTYFSGKCVEHNNQWIHGRMYVPLEGYIYNDNGEIKVTKTFEDNFKEVWFVPEHINNSSLGKLSQELPLKLHFQICSLIFENELDCRSTANAIGELTYEIIVELNIFDKKHEIFIGNVLEYLIKDKECENYGG